MRRRTMPTASGLAFAALLCLTAQPLQASSPRVRALRPVWADATSEAIPAPAATIPATLAPDLVTDPLDASWVGMPLPTLYFSSTPSGNVEFGGKLILAGLFSSAASVLAHSIVSWDGSQFGSMGDPNMSAQSLTVWSGALYAGGTDFLGHALVSRWDGSSWTPVGTALGGQFNNPRITCLEVSNGDLVAAGDFSSIDGVPATRVARFDGSSWHAMGAGFA